MPTLQENRDSLFPLSINQENILSLEKAIPGTSVNHISATVCIRGRVSEDAIRRAIGLVLEKDASLRTRITLRDGVPMQYHGENGDPELPVITFTSFHPEDFACWIQSYCQKPIFDFDAPLYRFVLCKTGQSSARLLVITHHIISDGWSQLMLCNRIGEAYLAILDGNPPEWEAFPDYREFVDAQQKYLHSPAYEQDREYWQQVFSSRAEPAALKVPRGAVVSHVGRRKSFHLSGQLNQAIYDFTQNQRVAPFSVLYMAMAIYLRQAGMGSRFAVGVPIFNRSNFRYKQTTGMFVSTLPFVNEISPDWTFRSFCQELSESWMEMLRHQRFPFAQIEKIAAAGQPLYQVMLSYQDCKLLENYDTSVSISGLWHYSGYQAEQLCIHMTNLEGNRVYSVDYDYLTQVFSEQEITALHETLCQILSFGLSNPDLPLNAIPLISEIGRERVLYRFNETKALRSPGTPYSLLKEVALQSPRRAAVICGGVRTTYHDLISRGQYVAAALPKAKALAAVLLPRDVRLFYALTGIMQAGCAWLLLSPDQPVQRICQILESSEADCLLTVPELANRLGTPALPVIDVDSLYRTKSEATDVSPADLAYVVYTSGSTGKPKGVEITCEGLCNLAMAMRPYYRGGAVLSLCNVGFDAFVLESAAALLCGQTILLADDRQKENPRELASLIMNYGVGFLSTTPSRLDALMDNDIFRMAARRLACIVCGGEPFPGELLLKLKSNTSADIYNQYGPSETTVAVSMCRLNQAEVITVGKPMENCHLYVLDESLHPLPPNVPGELYVGGVCVGRGYRNAPELTARSFLPSPFVRGERIYRTGDVACWTEDGEIELFGRKDAQVKLRGLRIEPEEISACLRRFPGVTAAAVRVLEISGNQVLVGYFTSDAQIRETELLAYAASCLPSYMIPGYVMQVPEIPLTQNGKVDEKRLPIPEQKTSAAAENRRQQEILDIFRAVLQREDVFADTNYFLAGGNSLNAMETIGLLEEKFGVRIPVSQLYACNSAAKLDAFLPGGERIAAEKPMEKAPVQTFYPLTDTQIGLYLESCLDETGLAYHMPCGLLLPENTDLQRLEAAFRSLVEDEPLLRVSFVYQDGKLMARLQEHGALSLDKIEAEDEKTAVSAFLRPFDLGKAPLMRIALWEKEPGVRLLFVDVHHLISDGLSTPLMFRRLDAFYSGASLPEHRSYLDYAWQRQNRPAPEQIVRAWEEALADCSPVLELPLDKVRPKRFDYRGAHLRHEFTPAASRTVDRLCSDHGLTHYMLLAGALGMVLGSLSGQKDLLIGTPVSQRTTPALKQVCGPLVSTVPVRLRLQGTLKEYFERVRQNTLFAIDHGDVSMGELLSRLNVPHSDDRNPLYQVLFQIRPLDPQNFSLNGSPLGYLPVSTGTSKLDLSVEAAREQDAYAIYFEYASSLFDEAAIAYYGRCLETVVQRLGSLDWESSLETCSPLSAEDRFRLMDRPWRTFSPYLDYPIHWIIREQARQNPDKTAVVWHGQSLSFAALEQRACRIAGLLAAHGVERGDRVGIVCRRSPELLAALLGILYAGGAYVPFLTEYPAQRVGYMMQTAQAKRILCDTQSENLLQEEARTVPVVCLSEEAPAVAEPILSSGSDPAYVLFTSGSTGQPKGVQLPHRALSNLLQSELDRLSPFPGPVLCTTNFTFDIFSTESLLALAMGRTVILADEEQMLLPWQIAGLIRDYEPAIAQFTPSRLQMCLRSEDFRQAIAKVPYTILVGEGVPPSLVETFRSCSSGILANWYGPTEAAVYVTAGRLEAGEPVTIGTPLNNCRVYVLDENRSPVPPTAKGELYLAGPCLADGYIGREDLTEAAFLPDPFFRGQRMYRTGDLGRLRLDGRLECLGRMDSQIKINGNRVELQEITEAMLSSGAAQAAVIPEKMEDGSTVLTGFVSPRLSEADLKDTLEKKLPGYMIPAVIRSLDSLPENASGKIDLPRLRLLLKEPAAETPLEEAPAVPAAETVRKNPVTTAKLLSLWEQVLGRTGMSEDISFFRQGGSSLSALSILGEYFNRHWEMTLAEFYQNPTAREQAELLRGRTAPSGIPADAPKPEEKIPAKVPAEVTPTRWRPDSDEGILVTGATGFLGAHILKALLSKGSSRIFCLLRDGSKERLTETLAWYFGSGWARRAGACLTVVQGDICRENLGLAPDVLERLKKEVGCVFHCAADVRHYAADAGLEDTNLTGTRRTAEFAQMADADFFHVSTASVSGDFRASDPEKMFRFTEDDLNVGQNWEENAYISSKLRSEWEVYRMMASGLRAKVFRIGRLVGRYSDGVFQKNPESNAFYRVMEGVARLKKLPASLAQMPLEITPVDVCANAIVCLCSRPGTVFHVVQRDPLPLSRAIGGTVRGLQVVEDPQFQAALTEAAAAYPEEMASLVDLWNGSKRRKPNVAVSAERTHRLLQEAGFRWPEAPGSELEGFRVWE